MPMVKASKPIAKQQNGAKSQRMNNAGLTDTNEITLESHTCQQQMSEDIEAIRAALIEGERSGISNRNVDYIWEQALKMTQQKNS